MHALHVHALHDPTHLTLPSLHAATHTLAARCAMLFPSFVCHCFASWILYLVYPGLNGGGCDAAQSDQRAPVQYSSQAQRRTPEEGVKPAVGFSALMRTSMAEPRLSKLYCFRSGGVSPGTCAARDASWKLGTRSIVKLNVTCD